METVGSEVVRSTTGSRSKAASEASARVRREAADDHARKVGLVIYEIQCIYGLDASPGTIAMHLNARGQPSRRGATWTDSAVRRVLSRLKASGLAP